MVVEVFSILLGFSAILVCFYFYQFGDVLSTHIGQQIDTLYTRIWIVGVLLLSIGAYLVAAPFILFALEFTWADVGMVMLSSLFFLLICLTSIQRAERQGARIEEARTQGESYSHENRVQIRRLRLMSSVLIGVIIGLNSVFFYVQFNEMFPYPATYMYAGWAALLILFIVSLKMYSFHAIKQIGRDERRMRDTRQQREKSV